jgi:hypothetical protein
MPGSASSCWEPTKLQVCPANNSHLTVQTKPKTTGVTQKLRKDLCYKPHDFRIGEHIDVHGRVFLLHDADNFTKTWYQDNLGYGAAELQGVDIRCAHSCISQLHCTQLTACMHIPITHDCTGATSSRALSLVHS